jgi:hypothetical protein
MVYCLFLILLSLTACSDRERANPLDPRNPLTGGRPSPPQAVAGDRAVTLSWDFSSYTDITGYRLYRRKETDFILSPLSSLPLQTSIHSTVDSNVTNGSTYFYSISVLSHERESDLSYEVPATPGAEICWVADSGSGSILQISPDARQIATRIDGFQNPLALAVHPVDRSCWVIDSGLGGLYRVTKEHAPQFVISLEDPTDLSIGTDSLCWVTEGQHVVYLPTEQPFLPVPNTVEANFLLPLSVASIGKHQCWITDYQGNRLIFYNALLGRIVFSTMDLPEPSLLAPDTVEGTCWVINTERASLAKVSLQSRSILFHIEGLGRLYGIDIDRTTGHCWVATDRWVYRLNRNGHIEMKAETPPGIVAISISENSGTCWAISRSSVYKLTPDGVIIASAGGMSHLTDIAIDPGR